MEIIKPPGESFRGPLPELTAEQRRLAAGLRRHVEALAGNIGERGIFQPGTMDAAADLVAARLRDADLEPSAQPYDVRGATVKNVTVELPGIRRRDEIVIVGAHYDTVAACPGANDNATGVAAALELAAAFAARGAQGRTLRFAFFANEEPPFFQTDAMGSMVYARRCRERRENVVAMIALETIGCYADTPGSQQYPDPVGRLYPDTGNFIAFVSDPDSKALLFEAIASFRRHARFPSEGGAAPASIPGIGWSDHWSFWQHGYRAIMITDTAPFRYPHYHRPTDTPDKIDYDRMARVAEGVAAVVGELCGD